MAGHMEGETKELQEQIQLLNEERADRSEEQKRGGWLRYVGLSTAILAVFAAIAALQSSNLVNEALINQIKAADSWNEYEAERQKDHIYTLALYGLLDANASNRAVLAEMRPSAADTKPTPRPVLEPKTAAARAGEYRAKVYDEARKESTLSKEAKGFERETADEMRGHHSFEYSVALIQIAIAVGAVSALTRVKPVWYLSLLVGAIGVGFCIFGFV
jgi:hypothetical protein